MDGSGKTLAIMPAFNEAKNIGTVIDEVKAVASSLEVLVVDDGSSDNTEHIARQHGAHVICLPFNLGIGAAVQTGFKFAREHHFDFAIQIDSDGQHIPDEIHKLLDVLQQHKADICIGSRYLDDNKYQTPPMRRLGMVIFSAVNSRLIGQRITDNTSGFRAFNRKAILFLSENYPSDYPEPEVVVILGRNGFRLHECAVEMRQRHSGESSIDSPRAIYYMIKVLLSITMDVFKAYKQVGAPQL